MIFLPMFNENTHDSWSAEREKENETHEKYHDLFLIKWLTLDCIEQNPLSQETEKKCLEQFQSTYSNIFWDKFILEITKNLPKISSFEKETIKRMKKEFQWVML